MEELPLITAKNYPGLSEGEAHARLKTYGENARKPVNKKTWLNRVFRIAGEPMMLLLIATAIVYYFLGDTLETIVLTFSIIPIMAMEFFQESKTDQAIKVLDKLLTEYCVVIREKKNQKIEAKKLVPGDLVYVVAGDKIPADGYILNSYGLSIDESILTGEAFSVVKGEVQEGKLQDENEVYQGTMVVQGEGYMIVTKTGDTTKYGQLGGLLENIKSVKTPLQKKIYRLIRVVAIIALISACGIGFDVALRTGWTHGLLAGLTIAMALIPEEFPIVFSVFLIMGVWRMTKERALVREMAMVELLGSATVICTDKTGTLTEGNMALKKIYYEGELLTLSQAKTHKKDFTEFMKIALLSLEQIAIDPIEIETQRFARELGIDVQTFYDEHMLMQDSPFEATTKLVSHIWKDKGDGYHQFTAGAPESILTYSNVSAKQKKEIEGVLNENFDEGYRVIGVAKKEVERDAKVSLKNLEFIGLLIMSDPPRAGVPEAIDVCQKAGIRIIMITGDNKLTAHTIAEQIGMKHNEEVCDGSELEKLDEPALMHEVTHHDIFARVQPEQKYLIVDALQKNGEIVAMTGDGVNDAPALKKANIGISMGIRGTEVARAASGMVLMDDNFSSIVDAVKEGRRIYDNIRQAFVFLFSFHMPIVGLAVLPLFFGDTLIFAPIHIIFLELICDPAAVLGFEREKARRGLMQETPRAITEPLINPRLWIKVVIQGGAITLGSFVLYYYFAHVQGDETLGRTAAFSSLVLAQIFLILISREWEQVKNNKLLLYISGITLTFLFLAIYTPLLQKVFHLVHLSMSQLTLVFGVPLIITLTLKLFRFIRRSHIN